MPISPWEHQFAGAVCLHPIPPYVCGCSLMTFGEEPVDADGDDPVTQRTKIGILDCTQSPNICQFQKVESYPQVSSHPLSMMCATHTQARRFAA